MAKFDLDLFCKSVDKVTIGNGLSLLQRKAREAIEAEKKVSINPYAILALVSSYQSVLTEAEKRGVPISEIQKAISATGIKESIEEEKLERELARSTRKGGRRGKRS